VTGHKIFIEKKKNAQNVKIVLLVQIVFGKSLSLVQTYSLFYAFVATFS